MTVNPAMSAAAAIQAGKSAVKSGTQLALNLANSTENYPKARCFAF